MHVTTLIFALKQPKNMVKLKITSIKNNFYLNQPLFSRYNEKIIVSRIFFIRSAMMLECDYRITNNITSMLLFPSRQ